MVEVMKIMVTSFRRSHAGTAALSVRNPAAGHCRHTPPPEAPGHSRASLGGVSLLWGHCSFLLAILIPACASSSPVFLMMYSA